MALPFAMVTQKRRHNCRHFILARSSCSLYAWRGSPYSYFHVSSPAGNECADQSYHLLVHTQHHEKIMLSFIPSADRKTIPLVQCPSCHRTAELGTNTPRDCRVLSHTEQPSLGQGWSSLMGKRIFLLNFHLLWDVQVRTHQCCRGGKGTVWLWRTSLWNGHHEVFTPSHFYFHIKIYVYYKKILCNKS